MKHLRQRKHPAAAVIGIVLAAFIALLLAAAALLLWKASTAITKLQRIDEAGALYYTEYRGNYNTPVFSLPLRLFRGGGCSAFLSMSDTGEAVTGRNYDLPHKDPAGNITGLNVVVKCSPKGKYASINIADAAWFSVIGLPYSAGAPDRGVTTLPMMFLPYLCMDGMNEKGLTASILALDLREGESAMHQQSKGKKTVMINQLLRLVLDECATVEEAILLAEQFNLVNTFGYDYHLFVTDASGRSAVFEWRYNTFTVTDTDAATNFYVGYDDACDCYYEGRLKEAFEVPAEYRRSYRYGYGHGYERFAVLAEALDRRDSPELPAVLEDREIMELLKQVSQDYDPEALTSFTQYSVIYRSASLTAEVCAMRNYETVYTFSLR